MENLSARRKGFPELKFKMGTIHLILPVANKGDP